jgi:phosphoglycerate-specific signal transduction histidine kinase
MSPLLTLVADALVAVLLAATIVSSVALSRRITRLKNDEAAMRRTVAELMQATETAERAIAGLRTTLGDCDRTLAERLRVAERYAADLAAQVQAGETVMERIGRIVQSSRQIAQAAEAAPALPAPPVPAPMDRLAQAAAAAQAIAERAARRAGAGAGAA